MSAIPLVPTDVQVPRAWLSYLIWAIAALEVVVLLGAFAAPAGEDASSRSAAYGWGIIAALVIGIDAYSIGLKRLKLARLPLNSWERTSALEWALVAVFFSLPTLILYAYKRKALVEWLSMVPAVGSYANAGERKASRGDFDPQSLEDSRRRGTRDWLLWLTPIILIVALLLGYYSTLPE